MFGREPDLSQSNTPGKLTHSVTLTGTCANSTCRASLSVPHSFDAPMGWIGQVQAHTTCTCGTNSSVSAWSG